MRRSLVVRVAAIGLSLALAGCGGADSASTSAAAPIPELVVADWDGMGVESLCVESVEVYRGGIGVAVEGISPVRDGIVAAFSRDDRVRVDIVTEGCDATIQFRLTEGLALVATYNFGSTKLYTGAVVSGTLTLLAPGRPSLSAPVAGEKPTANAVEESDVDKVRTPAGAPFWEAVNASVCGVLIDWFGASDPLTLELLARDAMMSSDGRLITGDCPGYEPGSASN